VKECERSLKKGCWKSSERANRLPSVGWKIVNLSLDHSAVIMSSPVFKIPVARPDLDGNEERYVLEAVRSSWISSTGPFITRFESEFASICGTQSAIAVCNGTVALHLALLTLDVRPGDEVLVPSLTYIATANAVRYVGAEPVFVDVDPETWCIDPKKLEDAITRRTKGIIAVHLYGHPADMDAINEVAAVHGLWVVEDAAEAPMASYKQRPTGSLARIATFSFYGNKVITCGEGGALTLSDPSLEMRARTLRGQGVDPKRRYFFPVTGYNFRLTNVACAILCAQLEQASELLRMRRSVFHLYRELLKDVAGISFQPIASWAVQSPWLFCICVDEKLFGMNSQVLAQRLAESGIETRPFFYPLHRLPPFRAASRERGEVLPVTDKLSQAGLNLPTFASMTSDQVRFVCQTINDVQQDSV
jgi:perosamine synthetase